MRKCQQVLQLTSYRKVGSEPGSDTNRAAQGNSSLPRKYIKRGPGLEYFLVNSPQKSTSSDKDDFYQKEKHPYISDKSLDGTGKNVYIEVYGCQMNVNDTEIIYSILNKYNYSKTSNIDDAHVILLMTCAIRDGAEQKIWQRLHKLKAMKTDKRRKLRKNVTVGVIGCMAERLKDKLLEKEKSVDVIAGPDSYRQLPFLLSEASSHQAAIDVMLSFDETYADVVPVRLNPKSPSAFVSIMRGCDNMCTYCIVPFTRGKERSRPIDSILDEVRILSDQGIKEITLLGQNVNSYRDTSESVHFGVPSQNQQSTAPGFSTVYKSKVGGRRFADLLDKASQVDPEIRFRFTSPHPKDFPMEVLELIRDRSNICKSIHLPAQSGSNRILSLMRRNYTREAYFELVERIYHICGPQVTLSSDFICGFCGETEDEFKETLDLVQRMPYSMAFIFPYSMREKTSAHRRYEDDVPLEIKNERVGRLIRAFRQGAEEINKQLVGSLQLVLVEGESRRSEDFMVGRCDANVKVIFPKEALSRNDTPEQVQSGDYIAVKIHDANSQVLQGTGLYKTSLVDFYATKRGNDFIDFKPYSSKVI